MDTVCTIVGCSCSATKHNGRQNSGLQTTLSCFQLSYLNGRLSCRRSRPVVTWKFDVTHPIIWCSALNFLFFVLVCTQLKLNLIRTACTLFYMYVPSYLLVFVIWYFRLQRSILLLWSWTFPRWDCCLCRKSTDLLSTNTWTPLKSGQCVLLYCI